MQQPETPTLTCEECQGVFPVDFMRIEQEYFNKTLCLNCLVNYYRQAIGDLTKLLGAASKKNVGEVN